MRRACVSILLLLAAGCANSDLPEAAASGAVYNAATSEAARFSGPLPGRSARTVLHEQVNEAENLFFTEDGRLFVSGGEDIYEITRLKDGTYQKTDYFDEDCLVEGIVRNGNYLYGVCTLNNDDSQRSYLIAGELTARPTFHSIAPLTPGSIPNGMAVDDEGCIFITLSLTDEIVRVTMASALEVAAVDVWAKNLSIVNGIKFVDNHIYTTVMDLTLVTRFLRIPVLPDGSAGPPEELYQRGLALLDDIVAFDGGFILTDFVNGTLLFWNDQRGVYAETPSGTFYGPTSLALGAPPMFDARQLIVAEKGLYLVRDEIAGDLLSMYQLPAANAQLAEPAR